MAVMGGEDMADEKVVQGACHCGALQWSLTGTPESATACNCTVCRRYGVLWAYGYENENIHVSGPDKVYVRGEAIGFHFCPDCACVSHWRSLHADDEGRRRIAVNLRLAEPESVAQVPMRHFDGLESFQDLAQDGKCVIDYWF